MQTPTRREMRIAQAAIGGAMIAAAAFYFWPMSVDQEEWPSITSIRQSLEAQRAECRANPERFDCNVILSVKP